MNVADSLVAMALALIGIIKNTSRSDSCATARSAPAALSTAAFRRAVAMLSSSYSMMRLAPTTRSPARVSTGSARYMRTTSFTGSSTGR